MSCLIIIIFLFLHQSAKCHRTGNKKQIGCNDHHQHRYHEPQHCLHRFFNAHCDPICPGKDYKTCNGKNPVRLRRFFTCCLTFQHIDRLCPENKDQHPEKDHRKNRQEKGDGIIDCLRFYGHLITEMVSHDLDCSQFCKFGK